MTKAQKKYIDQVARYGYVSVSTIDSLIWRRRQALDGMVEAGLLVKYRISPSYDGYALAQP